MQQARILTIIEEIAPPVFAAPWDKSGMQVASAREQITHLAVSLDPTPDVVQRALEAGADMLLTHHPLTMKPRYPDELGPYHHVLSLLFAHGMPLYAAHTTLDANPQGPAVWLPDALHLANRDFLEPTGVLNRPDGSILQGGIGCVGDLPTLMDGPTLIRLLHQLLPALPAARLVGSLPKSISRLAVCPGSGASLAEEARRLGAELLITGDVKYHDALDSYTLNHQSSRGCPMALLDVGHFALEEEMARRMAEHVAARAPELVVTFLPGFDPFHFFPLSSCPPEVWP